MLLSDRESAAFFMMNKFNLEGSQLVSEHSKPGQEKYKIKIMEEIHMENDPNYSCRNYQPREYDLCLEAEFTRQTLSLLNCTQPWMKLQGSMVSGTASSLREHLGQDDSLVRYNSPRQR